VRVRRLIPLAALLAFLVLAAGCRMGGSDPANLKEGDCFDVPTNADRIDNLAKRGCNGQHGAEVFYVFDDDSPSGATYPTDPEWGQLIYPVCDPVFETYTGTPVAERSDIDYKYLVPTADRWRSGDRQVTCFITSLDGKPLDRSFRVAPLAS